MPSLDFLYYSLSLGFLILVLFISFAAYNLGKTLQSLKILIDRTNDITKDVQQIRNQLKSGVATGIKIILSILASVAKKRR